MNRKQQSYVGAAVIGLGRGRAHIHALIRAEGAELLAVCDKNKDAAERVAAEFGVDAYTDIDDLLKREDIELIHVCTPNGLHSEMLLKIAEAGKHAITEKPLDITLDRIDRAIEAFASRGLQLGCIFQMRLMPGVREMKRAVSEERLGKLILGNAHIKWYRTQQYYDENGGWRGTWAWNGGGSLMNQAIHTIDLLQWIMGPVQSVVGHTQISTHRIETEDIGVALIKFANGAFGTIAGTTAAYPGFGTSLEIFGTDGGIAMKDNLISQWKVRGDTMASEEADILHKFGGSYAATRETTFKQIQDMVDAVRNNRPPQITGKEGRDAVEIVLAIYESSKTGKEVHLPLKS
jgi:predicted dehydrogenase